MTSQPRPTRIRLSWKQIECRRCHEARVVGISCPTCSARPDPREVDPTLQRRQRLARDAYALLTQRPGRLQQLVQDEVLVKDMEDAVRRGYDPAVPAQAVLAAASNDRQAIRALLALAH